MNTKTKFVNCYAYNITNGTAKVQLVPESKKENCFHLFEIAQQTYKFLELFYFGKNRKFFEVS